MTPSYPSDTPTGLIPIVFATLVLFLGGCGREAIEVYDAPKPVRAKLYSVPPSWKEHPGSSMRLASFTVSDAEGGNADISFTAFPRLGVSDLEVVNLWRQQIGLPPAREADLETISEEVAIGTTSGTMLDMVGEPETTGAPNRIVTAFLHDDHHSWFFKMTGTDELVTSQKPAFESFLKSVDLVQVERQLMGHSHAPSTGSSPPPAETPPPPAPAMPEWDVPSHWETAPPTSMLLGKFMIDGGGDSGAEVTVSSFGGTAGGLVANVNRWRTQIGLSAASESDLGDFVRDLDVGPVRAKLVDMAGDDASIVAAIVPRADRTWFFKLMGNPEVVAREKEAFTKFAQSISFSKND